MKIFTPENSFDCRVNFVDSNNVFVGYGMQQDCCEFAGWFISSQPEKTFTQNMMEGKCPENKFDVSEYVFDPNYHEVYKVSRVDSSYEDIYVAVFKLVHKNKPPLFLHLFNEHNGYYGHGFTFNLNLKSGTL